MFLFSLIMMLSRGKHDVFKEAISTKTTYKMFFTLKSLQHQLSNSCGPTQKKGILSMNKNVPLFFYLFLGGFDLEIAQNVIILIIAQEIH